MSLWGSRKGRVVYWALLRIGWRPKVSKGSSHIQLIRPAWAEYTWAFGDHDEIGPKMLARIAKRTGLKPDDL